MTSLLSHHEIFTLGGVMKNIALDCWQFVDVTQKDSTDSVSSKNEAEPQTESGKEENEEYHSDDMDDDDDHEKHEDKKRRKSKKKPKKSKQVPSGFPSTRSQSSKKVLDRRIQWGEVREILFNRCISCDSIPSSGLYPLGLGEKEDEHSYKLDDAHPPVNCSQLLPPPPSEAGHSPSQKKKKGKGSKNHEESATPDNVATHSTSSNLRTSLSPLAEFDRMKVLESATPPPPTGTSPSQAVSRANEQIKTIHKEIKSIRDSRDSASGCNCHHLKLDKLNVGKLKSELLARKHLFPLVSPPSTEQDASKLIEEEEKNIEKLKKNDLIKKLKDVLRHCQLCVTNQCECYRNEIECSPLVCGCTASSPHLSTSSLGSTDDEDTTAEGDSTKTTILDSSSNHHSKEGGEMCANPFGRDSFDFEKVQIYRKELLKTISSNNSNDISV